MPEPRPTGEATWRQGMGRSMLPLALSLSLALAHLAACGHATPFPWPGKSEPRDHADVLTVNKYRRSTSQVLVRNITRATRANLDYAAYHANFMNADPEPEGAARAGAGKHPDASNPFSGALEVASLTGTPALSTTERSHPLALAPLVEWATSQHIPGADVLEDVVAKVRAENWGLGGGPQLVRQTAALAYLHDAGAGKPTEIWVQVEFAPWWKDFTGIPDADGDGYGEIYGRIPAAALGDKSAALIAALRDDYAGRILSAAEVKKWGHQLASYWYPSFNTDLVSVTAAWPDADTESEILAELGRQKFAAPTVVMRGKPQGKPVYNVFLVTGTPTSAPVSDGPETDKTGKGGSQPPPQAKLALPRTKPSPNPGPVMDAVRAELAAHGGSWSRWSTEVAPLAAIMRRKLGAIPSGAKATAGSDGFLFFGQSLTYATGGDLGRQRRGRNPIPVIAQFKKLLAEHGVDLLFVPVPTKEEIFPDKIGTSEDERRVGAGFVGKVVNPFERKFLLELGEQGIEVVDLVPTFLRARADATSKGRAAKPADAGLLYQAQDTHWTNVGLALAARAVGDRIKTYPWYKDLAAHRRTYKTRQAKFSRHGDLHSRLPEADKSRYQPENLVGDQVLTKDGTLYDDDPDSPIVVLGDSFTGVYQLMDCEHAGVSAHLAHEIGYPVDLVMSYGGGPNVRQKLLRRGWQDLATKKLVVWMMTARDLHDFWEGWQPVTSK